MADLDPKNIAKALIDYFAEYSSQFDYWDKNHPELPTLAEIGLLYLYYEDGKKDALLQALRLSCDLKKFPIPRWVAQGVREALSDWLELEVKTLDEAFDVKRERFRIKDRRVKGYLMPKVYQRVRELNKDGKSINGQMFEIVGEEFEIGDTTASNYYYEYKELVDNAMDPILKLGSKKN